jgi:hypothetical protein
MTIGAPFSKLHAAAISGDIDAVEKVNNTSIQVLEDNNTNIFKV